MTQVLLAGAGGFLGTHLREALLARGHGVTSLTRGPARGGDQSTWDPYAGTLDPAVVEAADVVVNLAGSPTLGNPHSAKWARELRESRVTTTRVLAEAIAASERRPAFLAGNGISYYGDRRRHGARRERGQPRRRPAHLGHPRVAGGGRPGGRRRRPASACCAPHR